MKKIFIAIMLLCVGLAPVSATTPDDSEIICTYAPERPRLVWSAPAAGVTYRVYLGTEDQRAAVNELSSSRLVSTVETTYVDLDNLSPDTTYFWVVEAVGATQRYKLEESCFITPPPPGPAPTNVRATVISYHSIEVAWDYPTNMSSFTIERRDVVTDEWREVGMGYAGKGLMHFDQQDIGKTIQLRVWGSIGFEKTLPSEPVSVTIAADAMTKFALHLKLDSVSLDGRESVSVGGSVQMIACIRNVGSTRAPLAYRLAVDWGVGKGFIPMVNQYNNVEDYIEPNEVRCQVFNRYAHDYAIWAYDLPGTYQVKAYLDFPNPSVDVVESGRNVATTIAVVSSASDVVGIEESLFTTIDSKLVDRLKGRIVLQVEERGEAWYISPKTKLKYYLQNRSVAYEALRKFGIGVSNSDLRKIPVGIEKRFVDIDSDNDGLPDKLEEGLGTLPNNPDTDGDGHTDGAEVMGGYNPLGSGAVVYGQSLVNRLKGNVLLQVESRGEAWYVNPADGRRYYLKDGEAAYQIMRYLSLGITNENLRKIPVGEL